MPKNLVIIFILFNLMGAFAQTEDKKLVSIQGEIKDIRQNPVSYAHILSTSENGGWISDYYGNFKIDVVAGDTLLIKAVSYHPVYLIIPDDLVLRPYNFDITMHDDTVRLKELVIRPWPATYEELKREFLKVEIDDPIANLDLRLPSPEELKMLSCQGAIVMPGPFSLLYDKYSKEARSKKLYAELVKKDKAEVRYNKGLITRITGLKNDDEIKKFMEFCALQVKFILESTDYELYAAILKCYDEFCQAEILENPAGN